MSGGGARRIPVFDAVAQYRALRDEVLAAVDRVLSSGRLILGPEVEAFEAEFAASLGAAGGCVGVGSGTDALAVALRAFGVGPGDEVVTVANTAVPTASAIRSVGALPVFCEVDPATALIDPARLAACLSPRTRAVVPVHLYGNVADVPALRRALDGTRVAILEDCAQAQGATRDGRPAGTFGDAAAFSFYPTKNLGAYGDGGLCYSPDPALAARMRAIRQYGMDAQRCAQEDGVNARLDELQAACLRVKLRHLPAHLARRRALAARYERALSEPAAPLVTERGVEHGRHLFVVRVPERDALRARLAAQGIETGVHYPVPLHHMPAFRSFARGALPHSERLAREVLSLPLFPELAEADVDRVCGALSAAPASRSGAAR